MFQSSQKKPANESPFLVLHSAFAYQSLARVSHQNMTPLPQDNPSIEPSQGNESSSGATVTEEPSWFSRALDSLHHFNERVNTGIEDGLKAVLGKQSYTQDLGGLVLDPSATSAAAVGIASTLASSTAAMATDVLTELSQPQSSSPLASSSSTMDTSSTQFAASTSPTRRPNFALILELGALLFIVTYIVVLYRYA